MSYTLNPAYFTDNRLFTKSEWFIGTFYAKYIKYIMTIKGFTHENDVSSQTLFHMMIMGAL